MTFAEPVWLIVGVAICGLLAFLYRRFDARQRATLATFASPHLLAQLTTSVSLSRRLLKRGLLLSGVALIFTALARPQWGFRWEETRRKGIDILFAVDTSKSMLAQDVKPDRLTRAKLAVTDLVSKLGGDRIGLIAFAGAAFLQSPLTLDYDAFEQALDAVDTNIIPVAGTDIATAIQAAEDAFGKEEKNMKILVLITDGEDLEAQGIEAAKSAAKNGLKIYTIGVGSTTGELIPVSGANGGTEFLKDEDGKYVKSHLDESTLKQIAAATGGMYQPLGQRGEGLETVYREALEPLPKQELASRMQKVFHERFQWPLALGLACLLAEMLIGTRRSGPVARPASVPASPPRSKLRPAATVLVLVAATGLQASPQSAERAYKKGKYSEAEEQYEETARKDPKPVENQFNLGAAAYKAGEFDKSLSAFQKTLQTDKLEVQEQAYYNLGNTHYRIGQTKVTENPADTIKAWQDALQCYDSALKLKPDNADSRYNRGLVQKKLNELQKQQQQNQEQDKQDQKDEKDQKQSPSQSNSEKNSSKDGRSQQSPPTGKKDSQESKQDQAGSQGQKGQQSDQKSAESKTADASKDDAQKKEQAAQSKAEEQASINKSKSGQPADLSKADVAQSKQDAKQDESQTSETQTIVGQMTRQEAQALLDSMKKDERALTSAVQMKPGQNKTHRKDW